MALLNATKDRNALFLKGHKKKKNKKEGWKKKEEGKSNKES